MSGRREAVANCTGEQVDSRTAHARQQTETVGRERATNHLTELRCAHWIQTETESSRSVRRVAGDWWLAGHLHGGSGRLVDGTGETGD